MILGFNIIPFPLGLPPLRSWEEVLDKTGDFWRKTELCNCSWAGLYLWISSCLLPGIWFWCAPADSCFISRVTLLPAKIIQLPNNFISASAGSNKKQIMKLCVSWQIVCITQKLIKFGNSCISFPKASWNMVSSQPVQPYCTHQQGHWETESSEKHCTILEYSEWHVQKARCLVLQKTPIFLIQVRWYQLQYFRMRDNMLIWGTSKGYNTQH